MGIPGLFKNCIQKYNNISGNKIIQTIIRDYIKKRIMTSDVNDDVNDDDDVDKQDDQYENSNIKDKMIDERDCLKTLYTSLVGEYKSFFNKYEKKKNKIFNNNYYSEKRYYKNVYINNNEDQNETLLKSLLNCNNYVIIRDILNHFIKSEEEKQNLKDIISNSGIKFRTKDTDFNITNSIDIFKIHIQDILVHMYKQICNNENKTIEYDRYNFVIYCLKKQGKDIFFKKNIKDLELLKEKLFSLIQENKDNSYFLSNLDIHILSDFFKIPILLINMRKPTPDYKNILNIQYNTYDTFNTNNPSIWINMSDKFINYFDKGSKKEDNVNFCVITETAYPNNTGNSIKKFINYKLVFKTSNLTNVNIKDDIIKSIKNNTITCKLSLHELNREIFHEYIKKHIYIYNNNNNNNNNLLNVNTYIQNNKQNIIKSYYDNIKLIKYTFKPGKGKKDISTKTYIYPEKIITKKYPDIIQNENRTNPFQQKQPSNIIKKTKRKANQIINKTIKKINKPNEFQKNKQRIITNSNNIETENIQIKTPKKEIKNEQSLKETNNKSVNKNKIKNQQKTKDNKILNKFVNKYTRRNKQSTNMSNNSSIKPKIKINSLIEKIDKKNDKK